MQLPTVSTPVDGVGLGYGYKATLQRVGNIVTLTSWQKFTQTPTDGQVLSETIPLGYRPIFNTRPANFAVDGSSGRKVTWQFRPNGSMTIYTTAQANDTVLIYATWCTNDPMPASSN